MQKNPSKHRIKPKKDRSGQRFGSWLLLNVSGVKRLSNKINDKHTVIWIYSCLCDCGKTFEVGWPDISSGRSTKCADCNIAEVLFNSQKGVSNFKNKNPNYRGTKDIPHVFFSRAKANAEIRNLEFKITIEDMQNQWDKQNGFCYYTGHPLKFYLSKNIDKRECLSFKASLDRIDSRIGYTIENIVWTGKTVQKWI